jgi:hypothetical protein
MDTADTIDLDKIAERRAKGINGNGFGMTLKEMARRGLLPTPTLSDAKGGATRTDPKRQNDMLAYTIHGLMGEAGKTSLLNPRFSLEMMGFPEDWTLLPFLNGE